MLNLHANNLSSPSLELPSLTYMYESGLENGPGGPSGLRIQPLSVRKIKDRNTMKIKGLKYFITRFYQFNYWKKWEFNIILIKPIVRFVVYVLEQWTMNSWTMNKYVVAYFVTRSITLAFIGHWWYYSRILLYVTMYYFSANQRFISFLL